ncbi:MAG TPA: hypothetical protein VG096_15720 [Bryobacteraceae bacterium]|nr:hypothetical protein [Bryobacteraceae bacterium]
MATSHLYHARTPISAASLWEALCNRMGKALCRGFHRQVSLPVCGKYRCMKCLREFDSSW